MVAADSKNFLIWSRSRQPNERLQRGHLFDRTWPDGNPYPLVEHNGSRSPPPRAPRANRSRPRVAPAFTSFSEPTTISMSTTAATSTTGTGTTPSRAEQLKAEGNALYAMGDFTSAHRKYTEALLHDAQNAILYSNRAACSLGLKKYVAHPPLARYRWRTRTAHRPRLGLASWTHTRTRSRRVERRTLLRAHS